MLIYAVITFAVGALGGLVLATIVLRKSLAPWPLSILHALLGASGIGLLLITVLSGAGNILVLIAFAVLVVTALLGFYLAYLHLRQVVAPQAVVIAHAVTAVTGVLFLVGTVVGMI